MGSIYQRFDTAYKVLRSQGIGAALRETMHKVAIVETYLAYGVSLRAPLPEVRSELPIVVRRATAQDFARFRQMPLPFRRHAEVHDAFGLDQCYLAMVADDIAFLVWIYYPNEQHLQPTTWRRLRPDEAEIANGITLPSFRGKGVYPRVMSTLLHKLKDEGYHYVYGYIESDNVPSRRGILKVGFRVIGRSWRVRLFYHYQRDPAAGIYIHGPCARGELDNAE